MRGSVRPLPGVHAFAGCANARVTVTGSLGRPVSVSAISPR